VVDRSLTERDSSEGGSIDKSAGNSPTDGSLRPRKRLRLSVPNGTEDDNAIEDR
jgi:hypothetical protein